MEAEHEELSSNPFFSALLQQTRMLTIIAQQKALVCVPSSESLKLCQLTPDFLSTHVLVPDADVADAYATLNGKRVAFTAGRVVCGAGFPRARTVMVVFEELYYDDDFNTIRVLRTNFPLEGKIPLNYYKQVATQASIDINTLNARTLPEHQAVLCRLAMTPAAASAMPVFSSEQALANLGVSSSASLSPHPSLPPVFASLARFIVSFNTSYVLVKGFIDHAGTKVKDACERIKEELVASKEEGGGGGGKLTRVSSMEASSAIEACVFAGIQSKLFRTLVDLYKAEETRTLAVISSCSSLSMPELGVRPELVCEPLLAVQHLQSALNAPFAVTPLQKLTVLEETTKLLTQAVDVQLAEARAAPDYAPGSTQDTTLAADDMLPFWIFLLLRARPAHMHANMLFMHHFLPASTFINTQQLKVHLANMQGAIAFLDSGKLGQAAGQLFADGASMSLVDGMMVGVPGPRRSKSTSTIVTNSLANLSVRDSPSSHAAAGSNPFARTPAAVGASATASAAPSSARGSFTRSRNGSASQLLAEIEEDYEQLQQNLQRRPHSARPSITAHSSHAPPPQNGFSSTHARQASVHHSSVHSSAATTPRSDLPPARGGVSRRYSSLTMPPASSSSPSSGSVTPSAVAAVAASSVERMGDFLAGLQRQDDGVRGRLMGVQEPQRAEPGRRTTAELQQAQQQQRMLAEQQQFRAERSARAHAPTATYLNRTPAPVNHGVLQLDDDELPPLIVQRTTPHAQPQRRF